MKLCLLSDAGSVHTQRWAAALGARGHDVTVLSLRPAALDGVRVINLAPPARLGKLGYLTIVRNVRVHLAALEPDLLHAHYATSYGLLGALSTHRPLMISAWGADVFDFPRRSFLHSMLLKYNLRHADVIASTSHIMKAEVQKYTDREVQVTPFGVDTTMFSPALGGERNGPDGLTIGLVKKFEEKYGIRVLISAFELLARRHPKLRLMIAGGGDQRPLMESIVDRLGLQSRVRLMPPVSHVRVPDLLHSIDIFAVPSVADSESFGVAAIEASACGLPVVASRIGGLPEVVIDEETGILVPPGDPAALAGALERLIESPDLRTRLGLNGRAFVERTYSWNDSVDRMERIYATACGGWA